MDRTEDKNEQRRNSWKDIQEREREQIDHKNRKDEKKRKDRGSIENRKKKKNRKNIEKRDI